MTHLHITSWVIAIILLFVVSSFYKQGKEKQGKIFHMILRLFYLIVLFTGIHLFFVYSSINGELIIKALAGIWLIVAMEMITVRTKNNNSTKGAWIQFIIAFIIVILLGFGRLPLGFQWFA